MANLIEKAELIKKKNTSKFASGSLERIYEYHEKCGKDASGFIPVCIKPEIEFKKNKKLLN